MAIVPIRARPNIPVCSLSRGQDAMVRQLSARGLGFSRRGVLKTISRDTRRRLGGGTRLEFGTMHAILDANMDFLQLVTSVRVIINSNYRPLYLIELGRDGSMHVDPLEDDEAPDVPAYEASMVADILKGFSVVHIREDLKHTFILP